MIHGSNDILADKKQSISSLRFPEMPDTVISKLGKLNYISKLNKKGSELKLIAMNNRIERLKYEEKRANMKIKQTSKKANDFILTRSQHYEEKKQILDHQLQVENQTNLKRKQIVTNYINKKQSMKQLKEHLYETKKKKKTKQKQEIKEALSKKSKEIGMPIIISI